MAENFKGIISFTNKNIEIIIAFVVVAIIGIIIVPMSSFVLDLLLVLNITMGIIILLLTLFTRTVLEFSTFPTLLLVTTMFRLALNISSTRLILSEGSAGKVIDAFANFVTGNNYIVGSVIFIIIVIVQMVVVTSGASRVSEVSARFTLDAMPGKQMAIDADLNSGIINEAEAKKKRRDLQREADFYGSMDGASKFVKGDAIAGILITLINLIGGILIFSIQYGMGAMEALDKFGKLTIGDGLVSQMPALLISIASGIIVTRSEDDHGFGESVTEELFGFSKVIMLASAVIFLIALVPAFPTIPFLIVALILGSIGYILMENEKIEADQVEQNNVALMERNDDIQRDKEKEENILNFQVEPIALEIGYGLISLVDEGHSDNLIEHISAIRKQCAMEMGIIVNPIRIRDNLHLEPNEYILKIKGNEVAKGNIYTNKALVIDPGGGIEGLEGMETTEPAFGLPALWIDEGSRELADLKGYTVIDPVIVLVTHLKEIIKVNSFELMGRQEVKQLLESLKEKYNVVIDELIPDIMSLGEVQKVLQNLLKEEVPINDLVTILEVLADQGTMTKDTELLTEHVRHGLQRTIVNRYLNQDGVLNVITVHPVLEDLIGKNIQKTISGSIPVLEPQAITKIFDNVKKIQDDLISNGIEALILTSPKIRVPFKNLISFNFPNLKVLSLNDVPNDIEIEALGMVDKI
ncbi:flagellar biosynthesis protein FlhA [Tissierella creatinophila]|uniref:Flagellar biosynthesis protein FlhA n=1 Tax=Tissierella creatinophila DSM 6911 TaxID=1123403 RepID=A0A1U7M8Y3_TISCR|nr:flagellar biosynthesis protein FlhA [Tissierella creatinophila]OLS03757.1 flagellar biosynthesis protein FlhA [Tissierella creatinophila DSM 6911]